MFRKTTLKILFFSTCINSVFIVFHVWFLRNLEPEDVGVVSKELLKELRGRKGFGLYVRMFHKKRNFYYKSLIKTLSYFWPNETIPLTVVLDGENQKDHIFGNEISGQYPYPVVRYEDPVDPNIYEGSGHNRMQRNMFYAEKYVDYEYIGFIDTDTFFVTSVTPDLMFENGKPVVIGQYGKASDFFWSDVARGTQIMFKEREIMRCMSYFPVIIKAEHLVFLRQHVEQKHRKPFDQVFPLVTAGMRFAQFNMMCQYIWNYHHGEYSFHLQLRTNNGQWHGEGNSPYRQPFEYYKDVLHTGLTRPIPRTSVHYRYHNEFEKLTTYRNLIMEGLCYSGGFEICSDLCNKFKENDIQRSLFVFEGSDWTWDQRCLQVQTEHYNTVKRTMTTEHKTRIRLGCLEVEKLTFNHTL